MRGWALLVCMLGGVIYAQRPLTAREFVAPEVYPQRERSAVRLPRSPLIQSYDLRTETKDFDAGRQEFTLRTNFSSLAIADARRDLFLEQLNRPDYDLRELRCALRAERWEDWYALYFLSERRRLIDSLLLVASDRQRLAERRAAALPRPDPEELFDARTELTDLRLDSLAVNRQLVTLRAVYRLGKRRLDFADFATLDDIAYDVTVSTDATATASPELEYDLALIDRELNLERAEGHHIMDFAELRYRSNPANEIRERVSFGLALRIQDDGNRKLKVRELELKRERLLEEGRWEDQLHVAKIAVDRQRVLAALEYFRTVDDMLRREEETIAQLAGRLGGCELELQLDIIERRLENRLRRLRAYEWVGEAYLGWLDSTGRFCSENEY